MEDRIGAKEFKEWLTYSTLEPFGAVQDDWRAGYIVACIASMLRSKEDGPINVEDYMPMSVMEWRKSVDSQSGGGDVIRRDEPQLPASIAIFEEMLKEHVNRS